MREKWIDNIKFFAAIGVFLCHYVEVFAVSGAGVPNWLGTVNRYPFSLIINGQFWVCVFAILSGYLLNKRNIKSVGNLIKVCINRYYRFVIPFFFANLFVFFLSRIIGFSAEACGIIIENEWIMHQYTEHINLINVVKNSIILGSELNSSFWIISHMLIGSWLIYISNYICYKLNDERIKVVIAIGLLVFPYTFFIGAVYLGSLFTMISKKAKKYSGNVLVGFF